MTKKEEKKITSWVSDYFCGVIMPLCGLGEYEVNTHLELDPKKEEKTFGVQVNFPYRRVDLYIRPGGIELYKERNFKKIRRILFHEAFHIFHWWYKEYATARYVDAATLEELEEDMADKFSIIFEDLYSKSKKRYAKPRTRK